MLTLGSARSILPRSVFTGATYSIALMVLLIYGLANGSSPGEQKHPGLVSGLSAGNAMGVNRPGQLRGDLSGILLPALAITLSWRHSLLAIG